MPELPEARLARYINEYNLPEAAAKIIITSKYLSDFYDSTVAIYNNYLEIANLFVVELFRLINEYQIDKDFKFTPKELARLAEMLDQGILTRAAQKTVLEIMYTCGGTPDNIAKQENLILENDLAALEQAIEQVLSGHQKAVQEYKDGSQKVFGFLMGQVSRIVGKSTSPAIIKEKLTKALE